MRARLSFKSRPLIFFNSFSIFRRPICSNNSAFSFVSRLVLEDFLDFSNIWGPTSRKCPFQSERAIGYTPNSLASWEAVLSPFKTSVIALGLKSCENFRRIGVIFVLPSLGGYKFSRWS